MYIMPEICQWNYINTSKHTVCTHRIFNGISHVTGDGTIEKADTFNNN